MLDVIPIRRAARSSSPASAAPTRQLGKEFDTALLGPIQVLGTPFS